MIEPSVQQLQLPQRQQFYLPASNGSLADPDLVEVEELETLEKAARPTELRPVSAFGPGAEVKIGPDLSQGSRARAGLGRPTPVPIYVVTYLHVQTERGPQFIDITQVIEQFVVSNKVEVGSVLVYSQHTTTAIKINENEPLLIEDMCERLSRLFPPGDATAYRHNNFDIRTHNMTPEEHPNGHSHCQHLLLSTSETIPVVGGRLQLGRWQSVFLVELDCARSRQVVLMVNGFARSEVE